MTVQKMAAGAKFPDIDVPRLGGGTLNLGQPEGGHDWKLVVVYRGKHCPICTSYLKTLNTLLPDFLALGIDVVAVSGDPETKAADQMTEVAPHYPIGYGLTEAQMHTLGLYVSAPRSAQETDRNFAEPGLFVINHEGKVQITDISNAPFARPDLSALLGGLRFVRNPDNNYPIRGTVNHP